MLLFALCFLFTFGKAENNPLKVESYKLKNGLTVYLNVDNAMPMVNGMVVIKGGGKRDPKDATGIAHYFEHIMFKGTDEMGTIDYESEKVYLDSISALYDDLAKTQDKNQRLNIQKEINRISLKAAEFAIPNEVDKVLTRMGGTRINAFTSNEQIAYFNRFPANQIEKWLEVYSHRFINPVFRLFQSELETVYEEKNMYADSPFDAMIEAFQKNFFKNSPYGQQTILGTAEHLKNPSLSKMEEYFKTYYVANNMALILSGDFDAEKVKPIIEEKFGIWKSGKTPEDMKISEEPFKGREQVSKRITPIKVGMMGFRTVQKNHDDELALEVCASLLNNNSGTGLLDKLRDENKMMMSGVFNRVFTEIGGAYLFFVPKIFGQSLASAEKEVNNQLAKLKNGDFSDELFEGVVTEMKKNNEGRLEDMRWRTYSIMDVFVYNNSWESVLQRSNEIDKLTKEDVIAIANKYYGDNRLVFYSKMGFPDKDKVKKPPFKPIPAKNSEKVSDYAQQIEEMPTVETAPKFIDFENDIDIEDLAKGVKLYTAPNPINNIFSIRLVFGKGTYNDAVAAQAVSAIEYANPKEVKLSEFKKQLQLLGCEFYTYSDLSSTTIRISGLDDNLDSTLVLFNKFIQSISVEQAQLAKLSEDFKMNHKMELKDISTKSRALSAYVLHGSESEYLSRMGAKDIKALQADTVVNKLKDIFSHQYEVHYCGTKSVSEFGETFKKHFTIANNLKKGKGKIELPRKDFTENTIYLVDDKKATQSHINIFVEGNTNNEESRTRMDAFNDYMDGNMGSIVFQEIREFRSLAYGSSGRYNASFYKDKPGYFKGWLSTQADKTVEAVQVYSWLVDSMPQKPERINDVRKNLTVSINTQQPTFRGKTSKVSRWQHQGYTKDPRELKYADYKNMEFSDIVKFYKTNIEGKPNVITIVGNTGEIDKNELAKFGRVIDVKLNELYTE